MRNFGKRYVAWANQLDQQPRFIPLILYQSTQKARVEKGERLEIQHESNNGMHPTANRVAFMREACFNSAARRGG